jgi:hypothetical protein
MRTGLCSAQHVTPAPGKSSPPEVQAVLSRFLIGQTSDYADMRPGMAEAIRNYVRDERAAQFGPLPWSEQSGPGQLVGVDEAGDDLYVVHRKGGINHWNILIDREGKIEAAYLCDGPDGPPAIRPQRPLQ